MYKNLVETGQPISAEHVSKRFGVPLPEESETIITPQRGAPAAMKRIAAKTGQKWQKEGPAPVAICGVQLC